MKNSYYKLALEGMNNTPSPESEESAITVDGYDDIMKEARDAMVEAQYEMKIVTEGLGYRRDLSNVLSFIKGKSDAWSVGYATASYQRIQSDLGMTTVTLESMVNEIPTPSLEGSIYDTVKRILQKLLEYLKKAIAYMAKAVKEFATGLKALDARCGKLIAAFDNLIITGNWKTAPNPEAAPPAVIPPFAKVLTYGGDCDFQSVLRYIKTLEDIHGFRESLGNEMITLTGSMTTVLESMTEGSYLEFLKNIDEFQMRLPASDSVNRSIDNTEISPISKSGTIRILGLGQSSGAYGSPNWLKIEFVKSSDLEPALPALLTPEEGKKVVDLIQSEVTKSREYYHQSQTKDLVEDVSKKIREAISKTAITENTSAWLPSFGDYVVRILAFYNSIDTYMCRELNIILAATTEYSAYCLQRYEK